MIPSWQRLRKRKLFRWAAAYAAGAWLGLQLFNLLSGAYGWSPVIMRAVPLLLGVGFLGALVLAWYHGERGAQQVTWMEALMLAGILVLAGSSVALTRGPLSQAPVVTESGGAQDIDSLLQRNFVAVLPFANLSGDPADDYFADGITDELLNMLARIGGLRVPARTSVSFSRAAATCRSLRSPSSSGSPTSSRGPCSCRAAGCRLWKRKALQASLS